MDEIVCEHVLRSHAFKGQMCGKKAKYIIYSSEGAFVGYRCTDHMKIAIMKRPRAERIVNE
jgi:hypothetical protein